MPDRVVELSDLRRILREGAGAEQGVDLDGEILDTTFEDLGYDSLALMETAARLSREFGAVIGDEAIVTAMTPRHLLSLLNSD